jgi:ATP-binding cassette subfamily C protein
VATASPPPLPRQRVRTPTVLQLEAVECGAACLGIMLAHHGRHVPLAELRRACGVSRDGVKASKVVQAARNYGLEAKGLALEVDGLADVPTPFIAFWEFNHFLVVEGYGGGGKVFLNDPAGGHRTVTWEEFGNGFTGVVLTMKPGPNFSRGGKRARLLPALAARLRGRFTAIAYCLAAGLLLVLPALITSACCAAFVDAVLLEHRALWVRPLLLLLLAAAGVQFCLHALELTALRRARAALAARDAGRFFWRLLHLPMSFYAQRYPGEVSHRLRLVDKISGALSGKIAGTGVGLATMGLYGVILACFDWQLTAVGVAFAALNFLALRSVYARRTEASQRLAQDEGRLAAASIAGIQAIETLKASGMEGGYFAKWAGFQGKAVVARQELERSALAVGVLPSLLDALTTALVLALGGWKVLAGQMTLGALIAFQMLMHRFLEPVDELVRLGGTLQEIHADLLRLDDVMLTPAAPGLEDEGPGAGDGGQQEGSSAAPPRLRGEVEVSGLSFGYSPLSPPLFEDLNLRVPPGRWVALVGGSGSGKSTVARLIAGLYDPWGGDIRFDGRKRSEIPRSVMTSSLAFVDQDILLFEGTARDNLSLWDATVSDEELLRACRDAEALEVLRKLPGGLDAPLLEGGANLSGGERQRLEIARALVNNPTVLILDEATSALDAETERRVARNLRRRGCTCLWIAHRLSTVRGCDEILVLDRGRLVERGRHDDLVAANARYADLIRAGDDGALPDDEEEA